MAGPLIAVVDHEPTFMRLMGAILKSSGYEILPVPSGALAYDAIKREQPQLIVVDTWLAGRDDGWDLIQILRLDAATSSIPVIVLSSDERDIVRERFGNLKDESITLMFKPFQPDDLIHAIKTTLERHHS